MAAFTSLLPSHDPVVEPVTPDSHFVNMKIVEEGLQCSGERVVKVPGKFNVEKYLVVANGTVGFVTLFKVSRRNRKIIQCHNSLSGIGKG